MTRNIDFLAGLLFVGLGLAFGFGAIGYRFGSPSNMGAGFLPICLSVIVALLGVGIIIKAWRENGERLEVGSLKPLAVILAAIVLFALLLRPLGFAATSVLTVFVATFAGPSITILQRVIPSLVLALFSTIVFITLLGLPVPIWPAFMS